MFYTRCILMCMRTNIVLNDDLLREAAKYSAARTKRGILEEALQSFIRTKSSEQKSLTYRDRLRRLETELSGLRLRESPLHLLKDARERS